MKSLAEKGHRAVFVACAMASAIGIAAPARALTLGPAAPEFRIDPSIRSQAMGGASGAVSWGWGQNYWANPALLGLSDGITYEGGTTGSDFNTDRWTLGHGGVGITTAGRPITGLGGLELVVDPDQGLSEEIRSWGIGLSVSGIAASLAGLAHGEPPGLTRYAELAFGYNRKTLEPFTFPFLGTVISSGAVVGVDWGVLARGSVPFHLGAGAIPARVEAGYSYSVQNANDVTASLDYGGIDGTRGVVLHAERPRRHGLAARFAMDLPATWRERLPAWLAPGFEPVVSLGGAWDRELIGVGDEPLVTDKTHVGGELGLGNVAFVRLGSQSGNGFDLTIANAPRRWGYGLALPMWRLGGVQYDETRLGEFDGIPAATSRAWLVWVSPVEIVRALR